MQNTLTFAKQQDKNDPIRSYRKQFIFPKHNGKNCLYLCGNSLGLQPKSVKKAIEGELNQWATFAVEGHFRGERPWMHYHKYLAPQTAAIVGAKEDEVIVMNTLTVNLHLLMVSFYRPTAQRYKIIMEAKAFPSDQYAIETQVKFHGYNPDDAIIEVAPREGERTLRTEDILKTIENHKDSLALVLFGGVNYYTGQFFDMKAITKAGHQAGAYVGFDLAHVAGNIPVRLHDWDVDFAMWCSYKYMNAGPGGPSGAFVHEKHHHDDSLHRFAGWWGYDDKTRFKMEKGFRPMQGAAGWQLSNALIFNFAAHRAGLDIFHAVGIENLRAKSLQLTAYLEYILEEINKKNPNTFEIITPKNPTERGCQLSILTNHNGRKIYDYLAQNGVICDWREPNVIRFSPVPLYNSFEDVFRLGQLLEQGIAAI
jgi:kynureninase